MNELIDDSLATKRDIKELELRMTVKLGSLMVSGIGLLVVLMKILKIY